jgi:hypothetical protein
MLCVVTKSVGDLLLESQNPFYFGGDFAGSWNNIR